MNKNLSLSQTIAYFFIPLSIFFVSCHVSVNLLQIIKHKKRSWRTKPLFLRRILWQQKLVWILLNKVATRLTQAVAVQFALAVVYPRAGNLGGGGFLVYRSGNGSETNTLDYRERAPSGASRDMYLDSYKNVIDAKSQKGHYAAGVPGTVDGCYKMFQKYSKLKDWKKLVQPAVDLARKRFCNDRIRSQSFEYQ